MAQLQKQVAAAPLSTAEPSAEVLQELEELRAEVALRSQRLTEMEEQLTQANAKLSKG